MDFSNFSIARDFLYVSGALMGVALGYVLTFFRKGVSIRSQNRRLTVVLCVFSGVLAAFSAALVVSAGEILSSGGLFLAAGLCVPVFALAVFFPRTVAYPLILAGGLLTVWLGHAFLRFPLVSENGPPLVYVYREGGGAYSIRLPAGPGKPGDRADKSPAPVIQAGDRAAAAVFRISGNQPPLELEAARISFHAWYPLIGGTELGLVTLLRRGNETLYTNPPPDHTALQSRYSRLGSLGIGFQTLRGTVPLDAIPQGAYTAVSLDGGALSLRPSRQGP
jgi:hypothetical protein